MQTSLLVTQCGELKELEHFSINVSRKSAFSMARLSYSRLFNLFSQRTQKILGAEAYINFGFNNVKESNCCMQFYSTEFLHPSQLLQLLALGT